MNISSSAFKEGQTISRDYTADGKNISPALSWSGVPEKTKSLALICDDPDAPRGTWVHWVVYNLPAGIKGLSAAMSSQPQLADGTKQGNGSYGVSGYRGPSPPPGKLHHYYFKLYALDTQLTLPDGANKEALVAGMNGHVLAQAETIGTYSR